MAIAKFNSELWQAGCGLVQRFYGGAYACTRFTLFANPDGEPLLIPYGDGGHEPTRGVTRAQADIYEIEARRLGLSTNDEIVGYCEYCEEEKYSQAVQAFYNLCLEHDSVPYMWRESDGMWSGVSGSGI